MVNEVKVFDYDLLSLHEDDELAVPVSGLSFFLIKAMNGKWKKDLSASYF